MSDDPGLQHVTDERFFWSGRIIALCGATAEYGEYEIVHFFSFSPKCPDCKRLSERDT
ncbi:hypothetical protein G3I59_42910 [Amycolatopsis rubida]|uniref:Uncharacterized protein n=1 Tax=Amycolatopsis rubida TaxID=112413 RepID=A0ABX0C9T6_9PSEU|nr:MULTISPECIES: hypothetical protein [Amycolatopsis]MYW97192.1 hypothetical protein [Amycolatopsis rubida]NEC62177.1 hypothetical protein [Amycolatopsis rubida]OAP24626.1 hypothetical protein A4R44_04595 [Amycolatopsis sp. M39]